MRNLLKLLLFGLDAAALVIAATLIIDQRLDFYLIVVLVAPLLLFLSAVVYLLRKRKRNRLFNTVAYTLLGSIPVYVLLFIFLRGPIINVVEQDLLVMAGRVYRLERNPFGNCYQTFNEDLAVVLGCSYPGILYECDSSGNVCATVGSGTLTDNSTLRAGDGVVEVLNDHGAVMWTYAIP